MDKRTHTPEATRRTKPRRLGSFTSTSLLVMLTYGLYHSIAYSSYVTNFGWTMDALGYVSNVPFMAGASVGDLVASGIILALYATGRLKPFALDHRVPLGLLLLSYVAALVFPSANETVFLAALGLTWGLAAAAASAILIELLVYDATPVVLIVQLTFALILSSAMTVVVNGLSSLAGTLLCMGVVVALAILIPACRRRLAPYEPQKPAGAFPRTLETSLMLVVAAGLFELVVGLVNMFAYFAQSSFTIASQAPIQGMLICAALLIAFALITERVPDQRIVYLVVLPGVIAVFLLLPFFSDYASKPLSTVIYTAYVFTSLLSTYCYITACREARDLVYGMASFYSLVTRVCLIVGLVLGWLFGGLSEGTTFLHIAIACVVCVYALGIAVMFWNFRNSASRETGPKGEAGPKGETGPRDEAPAPAPRTLEDIAGARADELSREYGLTARERDVLIGLAYGNTAAKIAQELGLSTSTVQSYTKTLYAKLGVNRKQQVIDLFADRD